MMKHLLQAKRVRGVTLVELIVVVAILMVLLSLGGSLLVQARRVGMATGTRALLQLVEGAIAHFRDETGVLPYQDHAAGFPEENRLAAVLATPADSGRRTRLAADLATVGALYAPGGSQAFAAADVDPRETATGARPMHAGALGRLAGERARNAVLAGATGVHGVGAHRGDTLLPAPQSNGWADDYLGAALSPRARRGDAIIDPYGRPLLYVCPVIAGVKGFWVPVGMATSAPTCPIDERWYGLATAGRAPTASLASDITTTAGERYREDFELWSAGPDGRAAARRDDPANRDNLAVRPYNQGLK